MLQIKWHQQLFTLFIIIIIIISSEACFAAEKAKPPEEVLRGSDNLDVEDAASVDAFWEHYEKESSDYLEATNEFIKHFHDRPITPQDDKKWWERRCILLESIKKSAIKLTQADDPRKALEVLSLRSCGNLSKKLDYDIRHSRQVAKRGLLLFLSYDRNNEIVKGTYYDIADWTIIDSMPHNASGLELKHDLFHNILVLRWDFVLTESTDLWFNTPSSFSHGSFQARRPICFKMNCSNESPKKHHSPSWPERSSKTFSHQTS